MFLRLRWLVFVLACFAGELRAEEPNEFFEESTILLPGVLSVSDELTEGVAADTFLGSRGLFGDIEQTDDDGSPEGDGLASALFDVPTNSGSVDFAVTGFGDDGFFGDHGIVGGFEAVVTVYDFFGDETDVFSVEGFLEPGIVEEYSFSDFSYLNGSYDVVIDNLINLISDVDFFTFTGLTPGDSFVAETFDPDGFAIDTLLGLFDDTGSLIEFDDDSGAGNLSRIEGIVPSSGELTFAVSGFEDDDFLGFHQQSGTYDLTLSLPTPELLGDFNEDGTVDAADYTVWRDNLSGDFVSADYDTWVANFGATSLTTSSNAVPEPLSGLLAATGLLLILARRKSS